jgi:hypothetical protein
VQHDTQESMVNLEAAVVVGEPSRHRQNFRTTPALARP